MNSSIVKQKIIIIGGSAGSLKVILHILPRIKSDFKIPLVFVLHRTTSNDNILEKLLSAKTKLAVKEAIEKEKLKNSTIYLAPPDYHLLFENDGTFSLDNSEKVHYSRPSIDVTFESAAEVFGADLVGVLLSGANADGAAGLKKVRQKGGITMVQDPLTAETSFMPEQALLSHKPDYIVSPDDLVIQLNNL